MNLWDWLTRGWLPKPPTDEPTSETSAQPVRGTTHPATGVEWETTTERGHTMSSITLPYGASTYFTDGRFTGTEDTALQGIRAAGATHSFRESGDWHVVCTITVNGQTFDSDPKPSKSEALKNAVEKVYAAATAPTPEPVSTQSMPADPEAEDADALLSRLGVDLDDAEQVLAAANTAVKVLARLVDAGRRFV